MKYIILILFSIFLLSTSIPENKTIHNTRIEEHLFCITKNGEPYLLSNPRRNKHCNKNVARSHYVNAIGQTGWAGMDIEIMSYKFPHWLQGYAAGFLEGRASRDLIDAHDHNLFHNYCKGYADYCRQLHVYFTEQMKFLRTSIEENQHDKYWRQVNMTLSHLEGMIDGYEGTIIQDRDDTRIVSHFIFRMQFQAEIWDLEAKFRHPNWLMRRRSHCSSLVKLMDDNDDLLFSHATWNSLSSLLRMQKRIRFKLHNIPGMEYSYSGYPGTLASNDDFYLNGANLAIAETTNELYTDKLFERMTPQSVPTWIRSQVATRLSRTGDDWAFYFGRHNSGTSNNQWIIVDYKKFDKGMEKLQPGTLTILEQMPGAIEVADMSEHLNHYSYWKSFNRPYFEEIFKLGGFSEMEKKYGDYFSYSKTARSRIFDRDHDSVKDLGSLYKLMRSNNYMEDEYSRCETCNPQENAEFAIAARNDLNPSNGTYPYKPMNIRDMVATDVKFRKSSMPPLDFLAEAGPTHLNVPPFNWRNSDLRKVIRHRGQPSLWEFDVIENLWVYDSAFD